jgi:heptosyltransferase-3
MHLIISRTDAIGDVCLTLPSIGWLKSLFPQWRITLLVNAYAAPVAQACQWVDAVAVLPTEMQAPALADWLKPMQADQIVHVFPNRKIAQAAKQAGIAKRSGVWGRVYHWFNCNDLVWMTRARSPLHEAQLNVLLLSKLLRLPCPALDSIRANAVLWSGIDFGLADFSNSSKDILLHPYSRGNGREWPTEFFAELAHLIVKEGWRPVVGGTASDAQVFGLHQHLFPTETLVALGQDSLSGYMQRIADSAALVASSTGPLHVASAMGKPSVGIYAPKPRIDKHRWGAIGPHSCNLQQEATCQTACSNRDCLCMRAIQPAVVWQALQAQLTAASLSRST